MSPSSSLFIAVERKAPVGGFRRGVECESARPPCAESRAKPSRRRRLPLSVSIGESQKESALSASPHASRQLLADILSPFLKYVRRQCGGSVAGGK
ncbi:hypothetical protein AVEN_198258-1 [Araneus ventricosus]|uniref:Uncharacterized protein n=1 Tax=Araneus ventricosus TaxID=182803 RepID=A0A4Y2F7F6_ARAVE|nr:hypothetical protein AVEN_198258-1 [Araneus ventricosus]